MKNGEIKININDFIKVKLTDLGKDIFYHKFDEVNAQYGREILRPRYPKEDENGYTEFQLWDFMQLYGSHIGVSYPNVIDPIDIIYPIWQAGDVNPYTSPFSKGETKSNDCS